jgi:hypothetical protein
MNEQVVRRLIADLKKLQGSIEIVIHDFEDVLKNPNQSNKVKTKNKEIPSLEVLRAEWKELQSGARPPKNVTQYVTEYLQGKTKDYLTAFFKANALPISANIQKDRIIQQLVSILHVGSTITGRL